MEEQNNENIIATETSVSSETQTKKAWLKFFSKNFLALSILASGLMISGSVLYTNHLSVKGQTAQIQQDPQGQAPGSVKANVSADNDPAIGNKSAKVVMIDFSDFQCPFCRLFWTQTFKDLKRDYIDTGKILFVYRDYPLSQLHPMAEASAEAGECAHEQGKFWEFHDKLFGEEEKLGQGTVTYTNNDIKRWAAAIGLNAQQFNQCFDSGKYKDEVQKDVSDGSAAGVSGTPTFFINGRMVVGAQPYATFKAILDEELKK